MIRVIVPTMWKYMPFWDMARYILKMDVVEEFIIIDNDPKNNPKLDYFTDPKIKFISFNENIFVNPAWNCGAWNSKAEVLCYICDDVIFDLKVLYLANEFVTKDMGGLFMTEHLIKDDKVPVTTGNIEFTPYTGQSTYGYGVLFFIHKDNWIDIPEELLICYGDNFVFDQCEYRNLQNYMIDNLFHYHAGAQTSGINGISAKFYPRERQYYETKVLPKLMNRDFNF